MSLQLPWPRSLPRRPRDFTKRRRPMPMTTSQSPWPQSLRRDPKDFALPPPRRRHPQVRRIFRRRASIRELRQIGPRTDAMSGIAPPLASAPAITPPPASPSSPITSAQPPASSAPQIPLVAPAKSAPLKAVEIRELQGKLKALGFDPGAVDGVVGPMTLGAIRKYSEARAMANAEATRDLLVRLRSEPPPKK